jgi:hypothetical protein
MNRKEVQELFNHRPRNLLLATSDRKGGVNVAVYGSPKMIDEETVVLATRDCRSYQNLRENPQAAMFVAEPGEIGRTTKGIRFYLELTATETEGALLEGFRKDVAGRAGKEAAEAICAALRFRVTEVRPVVDQK